MSRDSGRLVADCLLSRLALGNSRKINAKQLVEASGLLMALPVEQVCLKSAVPVVKLMVDSSNSQVRDKGIQMVCHLYTKYGGVLMGMIGDVGVQ